MASALHSATSAISYWAATICLLFLTASVFPAAAQNAAAPHPASDIEPEEYVEAPEMDSEPDFSEKAPTAKPTPALRPTVNPVDIDREKPEQPVMHYYDKHGNPLETPVRFLTELDTVVNVRSGPTYSAFNGVSVGVNFFDGIMMIIGQKRASFDLSVDCSIHNWFFPVIEAGVGFADSWPDDGRCHYKSSPSFYGKVGMNYNFLYKSNPDYQVFLGLRAAMASFGYDISDITAGSQYDYEDGPTEMLGQHATCFYGQVLGGLKVKIWRRLSMGWTFRYAFDIHQRFTDPQYPAWFIPGKGTGPISATFSLVFSI